MATEIKNESFPNNEEEEEQFDDEENDYDEEGEGEDEEYDEEEPENEENNKPGEKPQNHIPESWEQHLNATPIVQGNQSFPQPQPQQTPPEQQIPPTEEKPKKKMMKLNPNASAFNPGSSGGATTFGQPENLPHQQQFGGFYPGGNQFGQPNAFGGGFQQFPPPYGGNMPWQQPPWATFNQNEFPPYQGAPYNPTMMFNDNSGVASFSRRPIANQDENYDEEEYDKETLKEIRKQNQKEKKKKAAAENKKTQEEKPKAPRKYKRHEKKDEPKPVVKKEKPKVEEETDTSKFTEVDETRAPINLVFIGHVDVGKSTICGNILLITGKVDKNELRKLEIEAKEKKRESWYLAYIMDINEEERSKGKTVEVGKSHFQTKSKRFTILDAPGHKNYVPNMIAGACQADYAALVISAKTGEFESGFEKGGQTREHAMLAKCLGVMKLIVVINKMDEDNWSKTRFDFIKDTLSPFLSSSCGFNLEKDVSWIPLSGLTGHNLATHVPPEVCKWYSGPSLFELIDVLPAPERNPNGPLRIPVLDKMRDLGFLNVFGKIESGTLYTDMTLTLMPFKKEFQVTHIFNTEEQRVKYAKPGENVRLRVKNLEENDVKRGNMICFSDNECPVCFEFEAKVTILELPEHKPIFSQGYKAIIHLHTIVEEIEVNQVLAITDKENKQIKCHFLKNGTTGIVRLQCSTYLCLEKCELNPHLGRFTLRDEGRTIALGEVTKIKVVKGVVQTVPTLVSEKKETKGPEEEKKIEEVKKEETENCL